MSIQGNFVGGIIPTAEQVGALPIDGGTVNGEFKVGTNGLTLWESAYEGGNLRVKPPAGKTADWWEMDAYDGHLRFHTQKNATDPDGAGGKTALKLYTDGSFTSGNNAKTRENLGVAPATADTNYPSCYYRIVDGVKEWINPPLQLNTEYRTTERHNGKPVFVKRINCGAFPANTSKDISHGISSFGTSVRSVGRTSQRLSMTMKYVTDFYFGPTGIHVETNIDASHITFEVDLYYTKN